MSLPTTYIEPGYFISDELTGTGSVQGTSHGLGVVPRVVFAFPTGNTNATWGVWSITEGTYDATTCKFTVTAGIKYRIVAFA